MILRKSACFFISIIFALNLQAAEYIVFGDAGQLRPELDNLRTSILKEKTKSVVLVGDQIYDIRNTYDKVWGDFKKAGLNFDVVALGNHHRSYKEEIEYFALPGEFYTKEFLDDVFIVLNSDNTRNVFIQMGFLNSELQKYDGSKKNVFIVFHHPLGTISEFHDWGERWLFQLCLPFVIWKFKSNISAFLVGHDHFSGLYTTSGIPMVLAGGAVDLRSGKYDFGRSSKTVKEYVNDTNRMWIKLVTGSGKATVQFVDVETQKILFTRELPKN